MEKLKLHSIVDVITNSSTVIYTYQDSIEESKELLQEILNIANIEKSVDDLFYIDTFLEDISIYIENMERCADNYVDDIEFNEIYKEWKDEIDYFVLLPYEAQGRAVPKGIEWEYLLTKLPENTSKIAFGAGFYNNLLQGKHNIKVSLYEPEIMSKFLDMKNMKLYPSSFNLTEIV